MRRTIAVAALAAGAMLIGSAATAGGFMCMLTARGMTFGKILTAPENGACRVSGPQGETLRLSPDVRVLRIQTVRPEEIRPGDRFVTRRTAGAAPEIVLFQSDADLYALYQALGHGAGGSQATRQAPQPRPAAAARAKR